MTAAISTSKKSFFGTRYRNKIIENQKLFIVNIALQLIGLPLITIITIYNEYRSEHGNYAYDGDALIYVSIFAICASIFSGILFARSCFSYLYTKSLVDMNYSLPLNSKQRFFADYLAGLTIYMAPLIAASLLSLIILGCGSTIIYVDWSNFPIACRCGAVVLIGMLMYYTLTVFVNVCCGSSFESVFGVFAANIIIPAVITCTYSLICSYADFGFFNDNTIPPPFIFSTSPIGILAYLVLYFDSSYAAGAETQINSFVRWMIPSLIVTAALLFFAYLLYKRRKAESVSQPYVYKSFYITIMTLGIYCILSMVIAFDGDIAAGITSCAIIYFILEIISKRGFRRFWVAVLRFAATVAAVFVFCGLCRITEGFKIGYYVPNENLVSGVEIAINESRRDSMIYSYNFNSECFLYTDEDVIHNAVAVNRALVDIYRNTDKSEIQTAGFDEYYDSESNTFYDRSVITITYYMKNGNMATRSFLTNSEQLLGLYESIYLSDEYAKFASTELLFDALNRYDSSVPYPSANDKILKDKKLKAKLITKNKIQETVCEMVVSISEMKKIADAYEKDLTAMTKEEFETSPVCGYLLERYPIRESNTKTLAALEKYDAVPGEITEEHLSGSKWQFNLRTDVECKHFIDTKNYDSDDVISFYTDNKLSAFGTIYLNDFNSSRYLYGDEDMELMQKVLSKAQPYIFSSEISGIITFSSESHAIASTMFLPKSEENDELVNALEEKYMAAGGLSVF